MGYIKVRLKSITDESGKVVYARYKRMDSDMPSASTLESNILWNALAHGGEETSIVRLWMELDKGILGRDLLGEASYLTLDSDMLNVDKLY